MQNDKEYENTLNSGVVENSDTPSNGQALNDHVPSLDIIELNDVEILQLRVSMLAQQNAQLQIALAQQALQTAQSEARECSNAILANHGETQEPGVCWQLDVAQKRMTKVDTRNTV